MSIRFACKCGKHLRAGDTMAGRHTLCPKCGAIVAIPKPGEGLDGAAAARPPGAPARPPAAPPHVPTPAELAGVPPAENDDAEEIGPVLVRVRRRNDPDPNKFRRSIWVPLDPDRGPPPEKLPRPVRTNRRRYVWELEKHWYQSLAYPFRAWQVFLALSVAQAGLLIWAAILIPRLSLGTNLPPVAEPIVFGLAVVALVTYVVGQFDCILTSAAAGEYRIFRFPGWDVGTVALGAWVVAFLAGPVVPGVIGVAYWVRCGDPDALDWIILTEIATLACGYFLLELLVTRETGGWLAGPGAVFDQFLRIGPRTLIAAGGLPVLGYVYVSMTGTALVQWHVNGPLAAPIMVVPGLVGLFGTTFLLRLLGLSAYRARPARPADSPEEPAKAAAADANTE